MHNDIHYLWSICAKHLKYITSLKPYKTKDRCYDCLHIIAKSLDKLSLLPRVTQVVSGQERPSLSLAVRLPNLWSIFCSLSEICLRKRKRSTHPQWIWWTEDMREGPLMEGRKERNGKEEKEIPTWAGTVISPSWEKGKLQISWGTHSNGPGW